MDHLIKEHISRIQLSTFLPSSICPCTCYQNKQGETGIFGGSFPAGFSIFPKYIRSIPLVNPSGGPTLWVPPEVAYGSSNSPSPHSSSPHHSSNFSPSVISRRSVEISVLTNMDDEEYCLALEESNGMPALESCLSATSVTSNSEGGGSEVWEQFGNGGVRFGNGGVRFDSV